jgi:hypothetical protein
MGGVWVERSGNCCGVDANLLGTAEYVAVVAKKQKIALIVEGDAVAAFVLRIRREYGRK